MTEAEGQLLPVPVRPNDLRQARERAIATLTDAFSKDDVELDELEARLAKVHNAETLEEIDRLVGDLKPSERALAPSRVTVPVASTAPKQTFLSILGGTMRDGAWTAAPHMRTVNVLGGTILDFREARLPAGVMELKVVAVLGGVDIIVPPELAVETHGAGIFGGFVPVNRAPASDDPQLPVLRISGVAVLGGVQVQTRLPGESERTARKRQRQERKALKKG